MNNRNGFGLLEVIVAAVVLGFLMIGLNVLQKGNRESVLRVRARDAANFVAQHVLDSLGSLSINSLAPQPKTNCENKPLVYCEPNYTYYFEGKPQLDKSPNSGGIKAEVKYKVEVELVSNQGQSIDSTSFTKNSRTNTNVPSADETNTYAKSLEATVSWDFKKSNQSIKMAKVVR